MMIHVAIATERGIMLASTGMGEGGVMARESGESWTITFDGTLSIDDPATGKHKHLCGRMTVETDGPFSWVLNVFPGTAVSPMVTVAGTNESPAATIREAIIGAVLMAEPTTVSDETPR